MLTSIMTVFALFWLPGQVMAFLLEFENENEFILNYGLDIGYMFVFTNCVMNPLIFAYFSQCHRKIPRRLTGSSINPTIACELGFSTLRRESERRDSIQQRRGSLPVKRVPLARTLKRPSLPAMHQCEDITETQRKDLLLAGRDNKEFLSAKRNSRILPKKSMLPILVEVPKSDIVSSQDLQQEFQNNDQQTSMQKRESLVEIPKLEIVSSMQNADLSHNIQNTDSTQKRASIPGSRKKLSFCIPKDNTSLITQNKNDFIPKQDLKAKRQTVDSEERHKHLRTQKRPSFSILKTREALDPATQSDTVRRIQSKHGDVDVGVIKNFLEIMKTMKEDVLRNYLDATRETVLN